MFENVCSVLGYTKVRINLNFNATGYLWGWLNYLLNAFVSISMLLTMISS